MAPCFRATVKVEYLFFREANRKEKREAAERELKRKGRNRKGEKYSDLIPKLKQF